MSRASIVFVEWVEGAHPSDLPRPGDRYMLTPHTPLILGRSSQADFRVHSGQVARHHVRLEYIAEPTPKLVLTDLGSTNGTWVRGLRAEEHVIEPGETFALAGHYVFRFELWNTVTR